MSTIERVLLYSLVFVVALSLLIPSTPSVSGIQASPLPPGMGEQAVASVEPSAAELLARNIATAAKPGAVVPHGERPHRLAVYDSQGRVRIELLVDEHNNPRLVLLDDTGISRMALTLNDQKDATVSLGVGVRNVRMTSRADGSSSIRLPAGTGEIALEADASGASEVRVAAPQKSSLTLRAAANGELRMVAGPADGRTGADLTWAESGETSFSLRGAVDQPGPYLVAYPDGLSEVSLRRSEDQTGPSLLRLPDGVSIISVRDSNGSPAASMVSTLDGSSVIAAQSRDGARRAEMRVGADGTPVMGVVEAKAPGPEGAPPEKKPADRKPVRPVPPPRRAASR